MLSHGCVLEVLGQCSTQCVCRYQEAQALTVLSICHLGRLSRCELGVAEVDVNSCLCHDSVHDATP